MFVHAVIIAIALTLVMLPVLLLLWADAAGARRRRHYEIARAAMQQHLRDDVSAILATHADRQRNQQPTVSVPITPCEIRERRRVLKLEDEHGTT